MNTTSLRFALVGLVAAVLSAGVGCSASEPKAEEMGSSTSNINKSAVSLGSYVEVVDVSTDMSVIPQRHRFEVQVKDKNGNPTKLHPGESAVFKMSGEMLSFYGRFANVTPVKAVEFTMSYTGGGLDEAGDRRSATSATEDFANDGWTSAPFTVPNGYTTVQLAFDARGTDHFTFKKFALGAQISAEPAADETANDAPPSDETGTEEPAKDE